MTKILNGRELAGYIKERQAKEVRALRQAHAIVPTLAIVQTKDDPVIDTYVKLKQKYGADVGVEVVAHKCEMSEVPQLIDSLNKDDTIHGIIVQLPLADTSETDSILALVSPDKDVDALGGKAPYEPATPLAILWLLAGYGVDFAGKKVVLIGRGKLVGAPLFTLLQQSGVDAEVLDRSVSDLGAKTREADIIITATGSPALLFSDMIKERAVVVDAGVASEDGKTVGDVHPDVYLRDDLTITPTKGGVGPLTVCALFENVLRAAKARSSSQAL